MIAVLSVLRLITRTAARYTGISPLPKSTQSVTPDEATCTTHCTLVVQSLTPGVCRVPMPLLVGYTKKKKK